MRRLLASVENSGPLGTSAVIGTFGEALELLATDSEAASSAILAGQALSLVDYFLSTRGRFSAAVDNCFSPLRAQLSSGQTSAGSIDDVRNALRSFSRGHEEARQERLHAIAAAGASHLSEAKSLLLYDYSSTVMNVVAALVQRGSELTMVVPESRTCAGFAPILRRGIELQRRLRLVPDAALAHAMPSCDAVLVGVESFFADGSFTNTIGSLTTAIVAKHCGVSFYTVTDLTKAAAPGGPNAQPQRAFFEPLADTCELNNVRLLDVHYPPLERVPADLVTGYITEKGVLDPGGLWMTLQPVLGQDPGDDTEF